MRLKTSVSNLIILIEFFLVTMLIFTQGSTIANLCIAILILFLFTASNLNSELAFLFFAINMIAAINITILGIPLCSIIELIFIIKAVLLKKYEVNGRSNFWLICLLLVCVFSSLIIDNSVIKGIVFVVNLLLLGTISAVTFQCKEKDDLEQVCFMSFVLGLSVCLIISLIQTDMSTINDYKRFCGLWTDPNYIGCFVALAICMLINLADESLLKLIKYIPFFALFLYCGYMTYSRSFVFAIILIMAYAVIIMAKSHKIQLATKLIGLFAIAVIAYFVFSRYLVGIVASRGWIESAGRDFTDGRIDDWQRAFKAYTASVGNILLGSGLVTSHNTIFDFLLRYGPIGALCGVGYILMIKKSFYQKMLPIGKLMFIVFLLYLLTLPMLEDDIVFLLFGVIPLLQNTNIANKKNSEAIECSNSLMKDSIAAV